MDMVRRFRQLGSVNHLRSILLLALECCLVDLAGHAEGQFGEKDVLPRHLEVGKLDFSECN
jgi:hypothetical protein